VTSPRRRNAVSAAAAAVAALAYFSISWDGWLTNFQVRWMCEEDRGYVLVSRAGVIALGIDEDVGKRDPRVMDAFARRYPVVRMEAPNAKERAIYGLVQRWPERVRGYWGFGVERTELSVVDRSDGNRVLATTSLYRRVDLGSESLRGLRDALVALPEKCVASDRVEFVRGVLAPAQRD
jgi:hypothetical protein